MFGLGLDEMFIILIAILIFVDPKHWNRIARFVGRIIGHYNSIMNDIKTHINMSEIENMNDDDLENLKENDDLNNNGKKDNEN